MRRSIIIGILLANLLVACGVPNQTPHAPLYEGEESKYNQERVDDAIPNKSNTPDWPLDEYGIPSIKLDEYEYDGIRVRKCLFYSYTALLTMDYFIEYPQIVEFYDYDIRSKINKQLYEMFIDEDLTTWHSGISFQNISYEITLLNEDWMSILLCGYTDRGGAYGSFNNAITFNLKTGETVSLGDIFLTEDIANLSNLLVNDKCRITDRYEGSTLDNSYRSLLERIPDHAETILELFNTPDLTSFFLCEEKLIVFCSASGRVWYFIEFEIDAPPWDS